MDATHDAQPIERLLVIRPTMGQGGADRVTAELLHSLDRDRFALVLVLLRAEGEHLKSLPSDVRVEALGSKSLRTALPSLIRIMRRERPTIVFSTSGGTNPLAAIAHFIIRSSSRLVLSERNVLYHGGRTLKRRFLVALKRLSYRRADCIAAVSQGVADDMMKELGLPSRRFDVVFNPTVTSEIDALAAAPVEHSWFTDTTPVVLGAGRMVGEKDFATLIRAFALLRARRPVRLMILGEGPLRNELQLLADASDFSEDIALLGFDINPFRYMARCDAFVLSSRYEGLPGVLIQAMACGAPAVSTDCPAGPAEIIEHGVSGFLVPVGDAAAIAEHLEWLFDQPAQAEPIAQAGRSSVQRFRREHVIANYERALTSGGTRTN